MGLLQYCCGIVISGIAVGLPRVLLFDCCGIPMRLLHRCCGIAELLLADTLRRGVDSSPPSGTAALARRPIALAAPLASGADVPIERSDSVISRADSSAVVLEVENA